MDGFDSFGLLNKKILNYTYFGVLVCYVCETHTMQEDVRGELELAFSNLVGPRITLKSSGLVANTFTTGPHQWPWSINSAFSFGTQRQRVWE